MRRIDDLGRIVIPMELRKKYGLFKGVEIEFLDHGDGITVKASEPFCKICRTRLCDGASVPLCDACIEEIAQHYLEKQQITMQNS